MGRRRKLPLFENVTITEVAAEGKALARIDNMVVFVTGLVPGDVADIQIKKKRKKYMEGIPVQIHEYSKDRTEPFCSHFGTCGGCKWQHLPYDKQKFYKQKQVEDNLVRLGKLDVPGVTPILGAEKVQCYRNKLEYTFSALKWLTDEEVASEAVVDNRNAAGFHVPGRFDRILDIQKCYLQDDLSNEIRNSVKQLAFDNNLTFYNQKEHNGLLRNLIVRNTTLGEWMIIVCFGEDINDEVELVMNHINKNFTTLTSLQYVVNQKLNDTIHDQEVVLYAGRDHIFEKLDDLKFKIGPKSFFQTNSNQAEVLYQKTKEFAKISENDVVYDLYTGTGTIANYVAKNAKKVVGIEYVEDAIKDAHINSELNEIDNTLFYAGDMKDILNDEFIAKHGSPDVIITDPPRAGMHEDVVNTIRRADPKRIVYVSCNPATQARDLAMLSDIYEITNVQPVDMFPHTHHVENIVALEKKQV